MTRLVLVPAFVLAACSGTPSEGDVRKALGDHYKHHPWVRLGTVNVLGISKGAQGESPIGRCTADQHVADLEYIEKPKLGKVGDTNSVALFRPQERPVRAYVCLELEKRRWTVARLAINPYQLAQ
jgi:hypothetical protein